MKKGEVMHKDEGYVVGIDLGGTKIAAALFDSKGTQLNRELIFRP